MLGYGRFHHRYTSGREGDASLIALSSRKAHISLYVFSADDDGYLAEQYADRLGEGERRQELHPLQARRRRRTTTCCASCSRRRGGRLPRRRVVTPEVMDSLTRRVMIRRP